MSLEYLRIENSPVDSNCFVLFDIEKSNKCILIDPGSEDHSTIYNSHIHNVLEPDYIFLTHEHFDHCWSVNYFTEKFDIKIVCSQITSNWIKDPKKNFSLFYEKPFAVNGNTITIESLNYSLNWQGYDIKFTYALGHTSAGIFIIIDKFILTGDTLIPEKKTATKLLTGSKEDLKESIKVLTNLKGEGYHLLPGHGLPVELDTYNLEKAL